MKFIIEGSQSELTELMKRLGGIETEKKKDYIPPLLTELAEDEKINELAEAIWNADKENAPQAEAAEQEVPFLVRDLGNRGYRTEHKENAPQAEAAEQSDEVGIAKQSINNLCKMISEKTAEFFDEYVNAVSNATDAHATFNHCFYLRKSAHEMWKMLSKSVVANIWDCNTLFL